MDRRMRGGRLASRLQRLRLVLVGELQCSSRMVDLNRCRGRVVADVPAGGHIRI